jgi:hypothetical protein
MRLSSLPTPGQYTNAIQLRHAASRAISHAEIVAARTPGGKSRSAQTLKDFFDACSSALTALCDAVAATVVSRTRTSATVATVVFSETLGNVVPALSSVTIPSRVVTGLAVSTNSLVVTCSGGGLIAGDVITYTPPATSYLVDQAGNKIATFTGALA